MELTQTDGWRGQVEGGLHVGLWERWVNGTLAETRLYDSEGKAIGAWRTFYPNGGVQTESVYHLDEPKGRRDFADDGRQLRLVAFRNGQPEKAFEYGPEGKISYVGRYNHGQRSEADLLGPDGMERWRVSLQ